MNKKNIKANSEAHVTDSNTKADVSIYICMATIY